MSNIADLLGRILISALFFLNGILRLIIKVKVQLVGWKSFGMPGILLIPAIKF